MSWYYAGPDSRPVGPISLEELQARRGSGAVLPETFVIEQPAPIGQVAAWKHFREIFPVSAEHPGLPPLPPLPIGSPPSMGPVRDPLFPSAVYSTSPGGPVFTGAHPSSYRLEHSTTTNPWCSWGFGLGLASVILIFACGIGAFLAIPALGVCIVGLVQLHHNRQQTGRGLAITGIVLALVTMLFVLAMVAIWAGSKYNIRGWTTTEQTTSDSD